MKSVIYFTYLLMTALCMVGCSNEEDGMPNFADGMGGLNLNTPSTEKEVDIPVIYTRSGEITFDLNPATFPVSIFKEDGKTAVKTFESFTALIEAGTPLVLPVNNYVVKASSFNPDSKVSDKPYFEGTTNFTIEEKVVLNTSVLCTFRSLGVELRLSDRFKELIAEQPENYDYTVNVSNEQGIWTFDKKNMKPGYFLDGCDRLIVKVVVKMAGQTYPERTWYFKNDGAAPQIGEYYIVTLDAGRSDMKMSSYKL